MRGERLDHIFGTLMRRSSIRQTSHVVGQYDALSNDLSMRDWRVVPLFRGLCSDISAHNDWQHWCLQEGHAAWLSSEEVEIAAVALGPGCRVATRELEGKESASVCQ